MLEELSVSNLGLIKSALVEFGPGLTVVTGETGTGKTLMFGALRLLGGDQAPKGMIGPHGDELDVSARLREGTTELVLRRVVTAKRSKAYVDDAIVTAGALADAVAGSVAIVGQHDQHIITSQAGVRALVDRCLDGKGVESKVAYGDAWDRYAAVLDEARTLGGDLRALEREAEMLSFQIEEIDAAGFAVGEEADLRSAVAKLRSAETLTAEIDTALGALSDEGAQSHLDIAARSLRRVTDIDPALGSIAERVSEVITALSEASGDLVRYTSDLGSDTGDLEATEDRLALLGTLKRKYGDSIEDIVSFHKDASARRETLDNLLRSAQDIEERIETAKTAVAAAGAMLTANRTKAAAGIAKRAVVHLRDLGFSDPVVRFEFSEHEASRWGSDSLALLFASDASLRPGPATSVASGGELSRLVLALTLAAGGADATIVAFDEIDAGIGGSTALAMGRKLAALASDRQVICVTHLPQVAVHGSTHLNVERQGTTASVRKVTGSDRVAEIARMLAGLGESETAQQHAVELLELGAAPL
jgi:DNA repair protein RecN (Recombination protein N)